MSEPLTTITAAAAAILEDGIDTDVIFPARFLLRMEKAGLGECLFADRKQQAAASADKSESCWASFALSRPDKRPVKILLSGAQFGCGSSREHAVWCLIDFGIRVVIAQSFGEIFASNAARNGLAAIVLDSQHIAALAECSASGDLTIDLLSKTVTASGGVTRAFDMAEDDRQVLINGWDEIDMITTAHEDDIEGFEAAYRQRRLWLFLEQNNV